MSERHQQIEAGRARRLSVDSPEMVALFGRLSPGDRETLGTYFAPLLEEDRGPAKGAWFEPVAGYGVVDRKVRQLVRGVDPTGSEWPVLPRDLARAVALRREYVDRHRRLFGSIGRDRMAICRVLVTPVDLVDEREIPRMVVAAELAPEKGGPR